MEDLDDGTQTDCSGQAELNRGLYKSTYSTEDKYKKKFGSNKNISSFHRWDKDAVKIVQTFRKCKTGIYFVLKWKHTDGAFCLY